MGGQHQATGEEWDTEAWGTGIQAGCMDSVSPAETHLGTHLSSIPQGNDLSPSLVFMLPDRLSVASPTPTVRGRDCTTEDLRDLKQGRCDRATSRSETLSQESMSCLMELSISALVGQEGRKECH